MSTVVHELTETEAQAMIDQLTRELGLPLHVAEQLAAANALEPEQYAIFRRIHNLSWLLGR